MANPSWLNKYLTMKPEVNKIFDDLDAYLDYCRFNLLPFNPADMYTSPQYKAFQQSKRPYHNTRFNKPRRDFNRSGRNENFSR